MSLTEKPKLSSRVSQPTIKKMNFVMGNFDALKGDVFDVSIGGELFKVQIDAEGIPQTFNGSSLEVHYHRKP